MSYRPMRAAAVSSHFGEKLKDAMKKDVDKLLGRMLPAFMCPLDWTEIKAMWNGVFPRPVQDAFAVLEAHQMHTQSLTTEDQAMVIDLGPNRSKILFRIRSIDTLAPSVKMINQGGVVIGHRRHFAPELQNLIGSCPEGKWDGFVSWLMNRAALEAEFGEAHVTIMEIINMASTVGQLRRMMPDLATYLNEGHRNILRSQQRASSLPHEFAAYDHGRLHRAVAVMAKCHLLPDLDSKWSERDQFTGAMLVQDE